MSGYRIAGSNRPREVQTEVLHVDYADVLRQAVENERHNVLREVLWRVREVPDTKATGTHGYGRDDRRGSEVKRDVIAAIERLSDDRP